MFDEHLLTSEDDKLCADIIKKGMKIMYAKEVIVYHHRRKIFLPLMKQFYYYGYYKCNLLMKQKSSPGIYVVPAILVLYLIIGSVIALFNGWWAGFFGITLGAYFIVITISSIITTKKLFLGFLTSLSVFLAHISYGIGFITSFLNNAIRRNDSSRVPSNK